MPARPCAARRAGGGTVKITDVAEAAGVAPMTVSRVLNTPDRVSTATLARVRDAIAALGYVPNLIAGGLSSRRSRMVAAVVPTIAHPMFADMIRHFSTLLRAANYQVMLLISGYEEGAEAPLVQSVLTRRPDALLMTGADHAPATRALLQGAGIPVVEIWDVSPRPFDMQVGFDHAEVGAAVAAYFRAQGFQRFLSLPAGDRRARQRGEGFSAAVRAAGLELLEPPAELPAPSTITAGREALRAMLPRLAFPGAARTALFCSSDLLAFGAITEARLAGLGVPAQLAVCGFGDFEISRASAPPFSTVTVDGAAIGRLAAEALLARLGGTDAAEGQGPAIGQGVAMGGPRVKVPFHIIHRGTT
ncbi:MAG: LacI family DNA-binding transcriptional regulator [Rhodospirillales bacterium]|nr:LacI family DNA-binding transcriptional regulator [Rhodospirillales bacterium]